MYHRNKREKVKDTIWRKTIPNIFFYNDYNPFTTLIQGDWYNSKKPVHAGEVYLNGKAM